MLFNFSSVSQLACFMCFFKIFLLLFYPLYKLVLMHLYNTTISLPYHVTLQENHRFEGFIDRYNAHTNSILNDCLPFYIQEITSVYRPLLSNSLSERAVTQVCNAIALLQVHITMLTSSSFNSYSSPFILLTDLSSMLLLLFYLTQ